MYMDSAKCVSAMIKTSKIVFPIKNLKHSDEKNYYGILRKCKQMVE
jgi:hypothetical protein